MHQFLKFIFGIKLYMFRQFSVHQQEFFTVHTAVVYVIQLASRISTDASWSWSQAVSKPVWHIPLLMCTVKNSWWWTEELSETCRVLFKFCSQALSKPVWHIPLLCVQWNDGQRNCPKHVEFYSKSCSQAVSKPVWHIPLLCVQWKTPDDGHRGTVRNM